MQTTHTHILYILNALGGHVVRADVMTDLDGRSKGCGIVEYASPMEAKDAIVRLNNTELLGRPVHIREDRENPNAPRSAFVGIRPVTDNSM